MKATNAKQNAKTRRCIRRLDFSMMLVLICAQICSWSARAAFVYELPNEFLSSGDFNGDGILDTLVMDRATGNVRIGYQAVDGGLSWSPPFTNGVAGVTGVGIGRFVVTNRDAIAVTASEFNRVALMNVPIAGSNSAPVIIAPGYPAVTNNLIAGWDFAALPATTVSTATPAAIPSTVGTGTLDVSAFGLGTPQGTNPERTSFSGATLNAFPGSVDGNPGTALALANSSANGKSAIFTFSMAGRRDLVLTFDTRGTTTGFNSGTWAWSTNGINYTTLAGINTATTNVNFNTVTVNFSSETALNNADIVCLRYTLSGATAPAGNNRLDNIQLNAGPLAPVGIGPHGLAGLSSPFGTNAPFDRLLCASSQNSTPTERLTLMGLDAGTIASARDYAETTLLERVNPLAVASNVTWAVGMARGTNDALHIWRFTNSPGLILVSSNLSAGSEYTFGKFYLELWPRFITYVPGESNLTVFALEDVNTTPRFGAAQIFAMGKPILGVFYTDLGTNGQLWVQFGDGLLGTRPPVGSGQMQSNFWVNAGSSGNSPIGVIGTGINKAAFLFSASNSGVTDFAKTLALNGTTWTETGSNSLSRVTTSATRANVWLFTSEPFVNANAGFVAAVSAPDWSRSVGGLPANLSVSVESDGGPTNGLSASATNNLGTPPVGSVFATPNQYHPAISLFGYSSATAPEPIVVTISPPPGVYGSSSVKVIISKQNPAHTVRYRLSSGADWATYVAALTLTNDTTVQFYGEYPLNNQRGRLQSATYSLSRSNLPPAPTLVLPGTETNLPPGMNTNVTVIAQSGTIIYGRRSTLGALRGMLGPTPYTSFTNGPFARTNNFTYFYVEDFEDGAFNTPGATPSTDWGVAGPGLSADSVDSGGRSFYSAVTQTNLTITFNAAALGGKLPTHAGLAWTDVGTVTSGVNGFGNVQFTARDANGLTLGTNTGIGLGDGTSVAAKGDDRFFGVVNPGGISSISIMMTNSSDWEVDHLQYGRLEGSGFDGTLWSINLDGSGENFITSGLRPRVSRDGQWMSFLRENDPAANQYSLWVRDLATGAEARLHTSTNRIVGHDWTADNAAIIFDNNCFFWRIGFTGTVSQLPLPGDCSQSAPSVNPFDGRVAFQIISPGSIGLYVASSNVTTKQSLGLNVASPRWPSWSPDGQRIAIANDPSLGNSINAGRDLFVVNLGNQTNISQITAVTGDSAFPNGAVWTPSGNKLATAGKINGVNGLWLLSLAADGSACHCPPQLLPISAGDDVDFAGGVIATSVKVSYATLGLFIRLEANAVVVYWSTNYDGFALESALQIPTGFSWASVNGPYFRNGPYFEYWEPRGALATRKYFRLAYPGVLVLTPSEPQLGFRLEGGAAVLDWPLNYVGYTLEAATNLSQPAIWLPLNGPYTNANGVFEYRRPLPGPRQEFYRLRAP